MLKLRKPSEQLLFGTTNLLFASPKALFRGLSPIRKWLNEFEVRDAAIARFLCRVIPENCPFEQDICLLGRFRLQIPPLCKLNPLYEEVVGLRFRALCYLVEQCPEEVRRYC